MGKARLAAKTAFTHSFSSMHLGPTKSPMEEWFPRTELEPNFYHQQEDFLFEWCQKHSIDWIVAMPSYIIGAVRWIIP